MFAVKAEGGPKLPIKYLGREVARTDASGAAHFLMKLKPGEQITLQFDTSEYDKLRPQNPTVSLFVGQSDAIELVKQPFQVEKRPQIFTPTPRGPTRL